MPTCTRIFTFDAGHRVLGHEGKCRWLHGHTYKVEVEVMADDLNPLGMVVDFSVLKDKVGTWIDTNLDHTFICHEADPIRHLSEDMNQPIGYGCGATSRDVFCDRKPYVMPDGMNPTAENLATHILQVAKSLLTGDGITVFHVRVWETPNCHADAYGDD